MNKTTAATHTTRVITVSNGGAKSRRAVCSCGYLGVRYAITAARTAAQAQAKAEAVGAEHSTTA